MRLHNIYCGRCGHGFGSDTMSLTLYEEDGKRKGKYLCHTCRPAVEEQGWGDKKIIEIKEPEQP